MTSDNRNTVNGAAVQKKKERKKNEPVQDLFIYLFMILLDLQLSAKVEIMCKTIKHYVLLLLVALLMSMVLPVVEEEVYI